MSGSGRKALFLKFYRFHSGRPDLAGKRAADSRDPEKVPAPRRKAAQRPPFSWLSLLDLFNDRAFARLDHICSVVALDISILAQCRRFPIDLIGEGSDLHGIREALPDPNAGRGGTTAGGALFYPGRPSMLANDLAISVGEGCLVRCRGSCVRSARAR